MVLLAGLRSRLPEFLFPHPVASAAGIFMGRVQGTQILRHLSQMTGR